MSDSVKPTNPADAATTGKRRANPSAPLRPLAPRPPAAPSQTLAIRSLNSSSSQSSLTRRQGLVKCAVCHKLGCQLITHGSYSSTSRSSSDGSPVKSTGPDTARDTNFAASYAFSLGQQYAEQTGLGFNRDMMHELPLDAERNTAEMHNLFYTWFMEESKDTIRMIRPPEIVADLIYSPFLMPAMQDPLLCLSVLAVSSAALPHRSGQPSRNVTSLTIVGEAIQHMRERIESDPTHISDSTIVAAVFLWLANVFLEDTAAMASHSSSVHAFVETRGGLHKLGLTGAVEQFIRWVDIINSFVLAVPCRYLDPPDPRPLSKIPEARYGDYWDRIAGPELIVIEPSIAAACKDTSRLLETLEQAEVDGMSPAEYYYIWKKLGFLHTRESVLRVQSQSHGYVNECVSVAIGLLKFHCFFGLERFSIVAKMDARRLVNAIKAAGGPSFWQKDLELLIWLLFIVIMVPVELEEKAWCSPFLCHAIASRFGSQGQLTGHWKEDLRDCLQSFVWCDLRLEQSFQDTCKAIRQELGEDDDDDDDEDDDDDDED